MTDANGTAVARLNTLPKSAASVAVDWPKELEGAKLLLSSGLLPQSIKTAQQALYVILTGRDLGLSPVQSLRSINVIQGKIEVAADMQLALFKRHGGRAEFKTLSDTQAVLWLRHWNGDEHSESFSMEDAKRAGLIGDNWKKYPRAMLRSRVITAGLKSIGFDVLAGAYAEGEIGGPEPAIAIDAEPVETVEPEPVEDDGPTEKQVGFFTKLLQSSAVTPEEREAAMEWLETKATRDSMTEALERLKTKISNHAHTIAAGAAVAPANG